MYRTQVGLFFVSGCACASRVHENCKEHLHLTHLTFHSVAPEALDRSMCLAAMVVFLIVQAQWFLVACRKQAGSFKSRLSTKNFMKEGKSKQWLCCHFATPFFLESRGCNEAELP